MQNYFEFIESKIELIVNATAHAPTKENLYRVFLEPLRSENPGRELGEKQALSFDSGIEKFGGALLSAKDFAEIRKKLRHRYGFDRIGDSPFVIIRKVLKRGRIASDEEAAIVRGYVSDLSNEPSIGPEKFTRLSRILEEAGY